MTIPAQILTMAKNLLRIPSTDASFDTRINNHYFDALYELTKETDLFSGIHAIDAVVSQSIYATDEGTTRILMALYNGTQLLPVPSLSLDLLSTWQTEVAGDPEEWVQDKIPPSLDGLTNVTPLQFAVHPAPQVGGTNGAGLTVVTIALPADDVIPQWIYPYLIYRIAALFSDSSTEERDHNAAQLWDGLAGLWKELLVM